MKGAWEQYSPDTFKIQYNTDALTATVLYDNTECYMCAVSCVVFSRQAFSTLNTNLVPYLSSQLPSPSCHQHLPLPLAACLNPKHVLYSCSYFLNYDRQYDHSSVALQTLCLWS
ncbi:hypothetical protein E2C01_026314 [Portunus trituberculatus]|uniref:Uncharacterized protein n=1 Tax=Portunus trituberculatus TaxID=210409 RepID=A0A5B7EIF4_PORTR|nr:hypothetical protein [Portunus trituberculatus]